MLKRMVDRRIILKIVFPVILIAGLFIVIANAKMSNENNKITKELAVELADKEMLRLGYDNDSVKIEIIEEYAEDWEEVVSNRKLPFSWAENIEIKNKLKDKKFWAIGYGPREDVLGRGLWVFIDLNTGKVIAWIKSK